MQPISRRAFFATAGSVGVITAVAACGSTAATSPSGATAGPDRAQQDSADDEQALIDAYAAVIAAYPALAPGLTEIQSQHADHLASLGGVGNAPGPFNVPATDTAAIDALRSMERAAARARRSACLAASDADLARLLTYIAASESAHAPALRALVTS